MLWKIKQLPKWLILGFIKLYQFAISPLLGDKCRYYPSCSEYTKKSLEQHGAAKGLILGLFRILRCAPYAKGGVDFPPTQFSFKYIWDSWKTALRKRD